MDRPIANLRVREDRVSKGGNVTVRYLSRLRHIGVGRAHTGERVKLLIADDHVRVVGDDGVLLRELVLDPARDYQPRLHSVHDVVREASTIPERGQWSGREALPRDHRPPRHDAARRAAGALRVAAQRVTHLPSQAS